MPNDSGVYIIKSLDGYRVTHAHAINNIYWWKVWTCCDNPVPHYIDGADVCSHCGTYLPKHEHRTAINPKILKDYFEDSKIFNTEREAYDEAMRIYFEIVNSPLELVELGICFIKGWENKKFPE